ncbi:hypothetical protein Tco_1488781 [Tanacetum coccineum]
MVVLPNSILCGESDFTMTKLRVSVLERGCSPIVISNRTSPTDQERFLENPTRGVFVFTLAALMVGVQFLKAMFIDNLACASAVQSYLFIMSIGASTGVVLLSFLPSPRWVSVDFAFSFFMPFTRCERCPEFMASWIWTLRCRQMCLCELLLLAKVRSELCFEIFVIKDATCFLTVPPYSGGVFKGIGNCWDPLSRHRNQYGKAFLVHLGEGRWFVPSLWEVGEASPVGGFPSEFAEGSP